MKKTPQRDLELKFIGPNITMKQMQAQELLQKALDLVGLDRFDRISAMVTSDVKREEYIDRSDGKLKLMSGTVCAQRIIKKCRHNPSNGDKCDPPSADHYSLWSQNGKPYSYVSQPYHIEHEDLKSLYEYAEKNGLFVHVRADKSWYYPGHSLFVELKKKK